MLEMCLLVLACSAFPCLYLDIFHFFVLLRVTGATLFLHCFIMSLQLNLQKNFKSQHASCLGLCQHPRELRVYLTARQTGTALGLWTQSRCEMQWWSRAGRVSQAMKLQNVIRCQWKQSRERLQVSCCKEC